MQTLMFVHVKGRSQVLCEAISGALLRARIAQYLCFSTSFTGVQALTSEEPWIPKAVSAKKVEHSAVHCENHFLHRQKKSRSQPGQQLQKELKLKPSEREIPVFVRAGEEKIGELYRGVEENRTGKTEA